MVDGKGRKHSQAPECFARWFIDPPFLRTLLPSSLSPRCALLFLLLLGAAGPLYAQVPDSSEAAPPDSLVADTSRAMSVLPPVGFRAAEPGAAVGDTLLALSPAVDAAAVLAAVPASFVYDLGALGWPNGWSPYGLSPQRVALLLNGLPFDDTVTGRPRYDLLPFALLEPLVLQAGRLGAPAAVYAQVRPFESQRPLTELNYRTSNTGLQSVMALHTQQRRRPLFGHAGVVGLLFGYGGHAGGGEYPGSRLRRMRQLLGRLRYEQAAWSVELSNLHNRRQLGAHGGVLPQAGQPFESIYTRLGAAVRNPEARRQTLRNDLALTVRARLFRTLPEPLTVSAYWTAQTFRYRNPRVDTLVAKTNRFGGRAHQDLRLGAHRLRLLVEGWTERLRRSRTHALPDTLGLSRTQLHLTLRHALRLGAFDLTLEGGLHATDHATFPGGAADVAYRAGALRLFADASYAGQPVSWIEEHGFGRFVRPGATRPDGRVAQGRLGLTLRAGAFDLTAFGFAHEETRPLDLYATATEDSLAVLVASQPFRRAGLGGALGWRRAARRGFYLTAQPTLVRFLNDDASALHARVKASLPALFAQGRLGARYLLFNGDLDLDVALQGRFWTQMRSRTLHPPTGLLVIPTADARLFGSSGTLDVVVRAGIRTATLLLAYENVLSDTQLLVGNLIVPVYPLPERRFRFGIHWPILN